MKDKMLDLAAGDRYHDAMQLWTRGLNETRNGYLTMGAALSVLKKDLWRRAGNHVISFRHFCEQELHISGSQALRLVQIYTEIGPLLKDITIDVSKVVLLLPHLHGQDEGTKKDMLEEAAVLTVEDLRNNLKEKAGEPATDVCEHPEFEPYNKCKKCGKWMRG